MSLVRYTDVFFHLKGIDSQTSSYVMYKVRTCGNKYFAICTLTPAKPFVFVTIS